MLFWNSDQPNASSLVASMRFRAAHRREVESKTVQKTLLSKFRRVRAGQVSRRQTSAARWGNLRCAVSGEDATATLQYATPLFPSKHHLQGLLPLLSWSHDKHLSSCTSALQLKLPCCSKHSFILPCSIPRRRVLPAVLRPFISLSRRGLPSFPGTNLMTARFASRPS